MKLRPEDLGTKALDELLAERVKQYKDVMTPEMIKCLTLALQAMNHLAGKRDLVGQLNQRDDLIQGLVLNIGLHVVRFQEDMEKLMDHVLATVGSTYLLGYEDGLAAGTAQKVAGQ